MQFRAWRNTGGGESSFYGFYQMIPNKGLEFGFLGCRVYVAVWWS